ncbi:MAG: DDE-type integrase/transposase/recombinase [Pseudomonadota bacterium]
MKDWLTARELLELQLEGLPKAERTLFRTIERQGWNTDPKRSRPRCGRGGGWEYRVASLPELARLDYAKRFVAEAASDARGTCAALSAPGTATDGVAGEERDARLQVVATANGFRRKAQMSSTASDALFVRLYNRGDVDVSKWVRDRIERVSIRSLRRWRSAVKRRETEALASDRSQSRTGTSVLDRAEGGKLRDSVLAMLSKNPHFKAKHIRGYLRDTYGDSLTVITADGEVHERPMPSLRTIQDTVARWREIYAPQLLKLSDPDGFRSKMQYALREGTRPTHINAVWQIDASPADIMTVDGGRNGKPGRANLYLCIDVFTRRVVFTVSTTPTASALGLLIRKALLAWGVPDTIKSDNGSDFTAKHMERLLDNLGVEHDLCTPFSPEQKGMVERHFGTLQRDLIATLPGFVGHNVTDRSIIENRKGFAQRLGEAPDTLAGAQLTNKELSERIDAWVRDDYERRPHGGLRDRTPFEVAATAPGPIRTVEDKDALRMLLAPVPGGDGLRTVTKTGITINRVDYYSPDCMPGDKVLCRMDPDDMGQVWLFSPDGLTFLGEAVSPEMSGRDPVEVIARQKAAQKAFIAEGTSSLRKAARRIGPTDVADAMAREAARNAGNLVAFPKPEQPHSTPALEAAAAVERSKTPEPSELPADAAALHEDLKRELTRERAIMTGDVVPVRMTTVQTDDERSRFRRAMKLERRIDDGATVSTEDAVWLGRYQASSEYRAMSDMYADFGDRMLRST